MSFASKSAVMVRPLRAGIEAARGEYVIMGDADDSYDFASLDAFVDKLQAGNDLVVGNRFRGGIEKARCRPCIGTSAIRCSR